MPWGHGVNCTLYGAPAVRQLKTPIPAEPKPKQKGSQAPKGQACPRPERPLAHCLGGGAALPRAGAFCPRLAARGSLSLPLLGFCCRALSLCGPRVNPISRGEAPVTPGLPHPRGLSPITPRLPSRPNGPARVAARGRSPFPAGTRAPGRPECASASRPGRRPPTVALGSAARLPGPPASGRARVGAAAAALRAAP